MALDTLRTRQAAKFCQRLIQIERFNRAFSDLCLPAGHVDNQRHACGNFVERLRLGPFSFFAEMITMIAPEDDDGFVAQV